MTEKERRIKEFIKTLPYEELFDKIREVTGISDLKFTHKVKKNYDGEPYIAFRSQDVCEHIGILTLMIKSIYIGQGGTGFVFDPKTNGVYWWGVVDFWYTHHPNGHNGHSFMDFTYDSLAGWKFRLDKDCREVLFE